MKTNKTSAQRSIFKNIRLAGLIILSILTYAAFGQNSVKYESTDGTINDEKVFMTIQEEADRLIKAGKTPTLAELAKDLEKTECSVKLKAACGNVIREKDIYEKCRPGVLVVATIFKCPLCPKNHIRAASGFMLEEGGIGVTSYHIFRGNATDENTDVAVVIMDMNGNIYPVDEVLAASFNDDIAIFRFDTKGKRLEVLPLGEDPVAGEEIRVISHPHSMFFSFTKGVVSRSYVRNDSKKMSITAEFSQGSSGAPVLDDKGNVVGIVSATLSLYNSDNNLQMVSRETIPVSRVKALIKLEN